MKLNQVILLEDIKMVWTLNIRMDIIIEHSGKLEILPDSRDYKENAIEFSLCYKTLIKNDFMMILVEDFECDYISNSNDI